jgi:hypothetical protein
MNHLTFDFKKFIDLLLTDERKELDYWRDLIEAYNSTLGGCDCSRKSRQINAVATFISKVNTTNKDTPQEIQDLKINLNAEKISFLYDDSTVFLEV